MNRPETKRAIQGILSRIRQQDGFATKTKLVKFLYLLDLESYRETGKTLTGFDWRFHLYGPWADEFNDVLAELSQAGSIRVQAGSRSDLDTQFLSCVDRLDLEAAIDNQTVAARLRRYVDGWAGRSTGELLDYVYFHTSPMEDAQPGARLDFSPVSDEPPALFFLESPVDRKAVTTARAAIKKSGEQRHPGSTATIQSTHDDVYDRIDAALADDDDY